MFNYYYLLIFMQFSLFFILHKSGKHNVSLHPTKHMHFLHQLLRLSGKIITWNFRWGSPTLSISASACESIAFHFSRDSQWTTLHTIQFTSSQSFSNTISFPTYPSCSFKKLVQISLSRSIQEVISLKAIENSTRV